MKKKYFIPAVLSMAFIGAANSANVTLYYSPTCPHCHHARDFIGNELVYEYSTIAVEAVNVTTGDNFKNFESALKKCELTSGGVPLIVIGDKCFQGYADFMKQDLRDAAAVGLSDEQKTEAESNRKLMEADAEKFRSENPDRANVIAEYDDVAQKKTEDSNVMYFYGLILILVLGLGFVLLKRKK